MNIYEVEQMYIEKKNLPEDWFYQLGKENVLSVYHSFIAEFSEYESLMCSIMEVKELKWDKKSMRQVFKKVRKLNWWKIWRNSPIGKPFFAFVWYIGEFYSKCYGMKWTIRYDESKSKKTVYLSNSAFPVLVFDEIILNDGNKQIVRDDFIQIHFYLIPVCMSALRNNSLEKILDSLNYFNPDFEELLVKGYKYPSELRNEFLIAKKRK